MLERGLHVDHTTIYRWVQHYAPEFEFSFLIWMEEIRLHINTAVPFISFFPFFVVWLRGNDTVTQLNFWARVKFCSLKRWLAE